MFCLPQILNQSGEGRERLPPREVIAGRVLFSFKLDPSASVSLLRLTKKSTQCIFMCLCHLRLTFPINARGKSIKYEQLCKETGKDSERFMEGDKIAGRGAKHTSVPFAGHAPQPPYNTTTQGAA